MEISRRQCCKGKYDYYVRRSVSSRGARDVPVTDVVGGRRRRSTNWLCYGKKSDALIGTTPVLLQNKTVRAERYGQRSGESLSLPLTLALLCNGQRSSSNSLSASCLSRNAADPRVTQGQLKAESRGCLHYSLKPQRASPWPFYEILFLSLYLKTFQFSTISPQDSNRLTGFILIIFPSN
ncbi:hypothetical protein J6590_077685 [Homalodisca vitripennis]|nr:hypothetical protein J6590_077685 [Homalodisca vitripennis]